MNLRAVTQGMGALLGGWAFGAMGVLVAALLLASCGTEGDQQGRGAEEEKAERTAPAQKATVEEIKTNPKKFYGKSVTVSGQITEAVQPNAFRIGSGGNRLLVVGTRSLEEKVDEGDRVRVAGTVRRFKLDELRKDVDYGIDDEYFSRFEGDPAIYTYLVEARGG